jgi:hypothetical protein
MIKFLSRTIFIMLLLISSSPLFSHAEIFIGEITRTGKEGSSFDLKFENSAKQKQRIQFWVSTETQFKGLSSLLELVNGDEVIVTAQKNISQDERWEADIVELSKIVIRDPGPEVAASTEIVEEKVDRAQTANTVNQDVEVNAFRAKFQTLEKDIEALKQEAVKIPNTLQEKREMLMGDLLKKKIMTEAKLNEYAAAGTEIKNEIFKTVSVWMTDLEETLLRSREELLRVQS